MQVGMYLSTSVGMYLLVDLAGHQRLERELLLVLPTPVYVRESRYSAQETLDSGLPRNVNRVGIPEPWHI